MSVVGRLGVYEQQGVRLHIAGVCHTTAYAKKNHLACKKHKALDCCKNESYCSHLKLMIIALLFWPYAVVML